MGKQFTKYFFLSKDFLMVFFLLAVVMAIAQTVQTISGFGSSLITVTLLIQFIDLSVLLPILVPLNFLQSLYICTRYRSFIDYSILSRKVIPFMGLGIILGVFLQDVLTGNLLKRVFGAFITITALLELRKITRKSKEQQKKLSPFLSFCLLISSGIIHGIYACGGPPLVYYLGTLEMDKKTFRSTLTSIWVISNTFLITNYWLKSKFHTDNILWILYLLPVIMLGIWVGDKVHHHICERKFRLFLFCFLVMAGISFIFSR